MKLELCVADPAGLEMAVKYHFDRIELCQALECGGLSPSLALQAKALQFGLNTHVLIRCRAGNFCYSPEEKEWMLREMGDAVALGVQGLVIGSLNDDHSIDRDFVREVKRRFPEPELTFHRAFDDLRDPFRGLEELFELGVARILTSGGKKQVGEGLSQLKQLIRQAEGRIEIMAGGGVSTSNIAQVLTEIRPDALHFSGTELCKANGKSMFDADLLQVSEAKIQALLSKIKSVHC